MSSLPQGQQPIDEPEMTQAFEPHGLGLEKYFRAMTRLSASDLHIRPGAVPHLRINTVIRPAKSEPIPAEEIEAMAMELMLRMELMLLKWLPSFRIFAFELVDEHGSGIKDLGIHLNNSKSYIV